MDAQEYIVRQIGAGRRLVDSALDSITPEQFNWAPPGTANRISATLIHMAWVEDHYVNAVLLGGPKLWESDHWAEQICVSVPPVREGWAEANSKYVEMGPVLAYLKAARAATDAYVAGITAADLDRQYDVRGTPWTAADVLAIVAVHPAQHAGEIAALKGIQGARGMTF